MIFYSAHFDVPPHTRFLQIQTLKQNNKTNNNKNVFFCEKGRSVGNREALPDGPEVRSGFYAARNYMVANKS